MRTLYGIPTSPFTRRTRLCLAAKGVEVALRDTRADATALAEALALTPLRTFPVLVDGAVVLGDSTAISHYLDRAYPSAPPLWPSEAADAGRAFGIASLVDGVLTPLVDLGTRYAAVGGHAETFAALGDEMVRGRAQASLDALAALVAASGPNLAGSAWGAADAWVYVMTAWLESLPARAKTVANVARIVALPWTLPPALSRWADAHRGRPDVAALETF